MGQPELGGGKAVPKHFGKEFGKDVKDPGGVFGPTNGDPVHVAGGGQVGWSRVVRMDPIPGRQPPNRALGVVGNVRHVEMQPFAVEVTVLLCHGIAVTDVPTGRIAGFVYPNCTVIGRRRRKVVGEWFGKNHVGIHEHDNVVVVH